LPPTAPDARPDPERSRAEGRLELDADQWRTRSAHTAPPLVVDRAALIAAGVTIHDPEGSSSELAADHRPLAALIAALAALHGQRPTTVGDVLGPAPVSAPFVVGVTGAVSSGKSVTAETLAHLLGVEHGCWAVVVSTDGFLWPNADLEGRGLSDRKGFPETYDHAALIRFLTAVKAGTTAEAPTYDHERYDVRADRVVTIDGADIVILEGLNVLQPAPTGPGSSSGSLLVSDFVDFSVYVDADETDLVAWFLHRIRTLRALATSDPTSFFAQFAALSDDELTALGTAIWAAINHPNVVDHIVPTRDRADLVIEKGPDHAVRRATLRSR
jgi:type I pantothenate kinase